MSIFAYTGLPGSGKSYNTVANQILPALKDDRVVVTNIPVYEDRIREITTLGELREFPVDKIAQEPGLLSEYAPPGCVLIIDELWKLFPAGQKVTHVPEPFKHFLAEHRHMVDERGRSTQVVFVTQDLSQIGMFARQLVEQTFHHTQLGNIGLRGSFQVRVYHGAVTGQSPPSSREINKLMGRYEERIYRLYKSNTMSKAKTDGASEAALDGRGNVWRRPGVIISGVAAVILVGWGGTTLARVTGGSDDEPRPVASVATDRRASPIVSRQQPASATRNWRVTMVLIASAEEFAYAVLEDDAGNVVRIPAGKCTYARYTWRCDYEGRYWDMRPSRRQLEQPIGPIPAPRSSNPIAELAPG